MFETVLGHGRLIQSRLGEAFGRTVIQILRAGASGSRSESTGWVDVMVMETTGHWRSKGALVGRILVLLLLLLLLLPCVLDLR